MKNKLLCLAGQEIDQDMRKFILQLNKKDYEIQVFDHILEQDIQPEDILIFMNEESKQNPDEVTQYYLLTDVIDFLAVHYRFFHQVIKGFILYQNKRQMQKKFIPNGILKELMACPEDKEEHLYKKIITNISIEKESLLYNSIPKLLHDKLVSAEEYDQNDEADREEELLQKYYYFKGSYYRLEPVIGRTQVLFLESRELSYKNVCYYYGSYQELLKLPAQYEEYDEFDKISYELSCILEQLYEAGNAFGRLEKSQFAGMLEDHLRTLPKDKILFQITCLSFLAWFEKNEKYTQYIAELILENPTQFSKENALFYWMQLKGFTLKTDFIHNQGNYSYRLYEHAYQLYEKEFLNELTPIPKEERDKGTIIILCIQFLSERHAPTRTTLERCYTLGKLMGKRILLINTREQMTQLGKLPLYQYLERNVVEEYNEIDSYLFKDYSIPFYQFPQEMPDSDGIRALIKKIRELRPYMIFCVGNGSIVSDLCAKIVPTACIPVTFSTIPKKEDQFVIVGRTIPQEEKKKLAQSGYLLESVIESTFTFDLIPQTKHYTRREKNLPEDKFLLIIVGIRLDNEIDDTFLTYMQRTFTHGTHLVFAGIFDSYEECCKKYPLLREHSTFVGYEKDILALMELCDLYINPYRVGGGFSIAEAFYKGKPGITIKMGDVAAAAGEEFCVSSYDEMIELIYRYMQDKEFYQQQSQKALARAKRLTNSITAMEEILSEMESRSLFF